MEDPRAFESQESSEGLIESVEARALDTATLEPEAEVEQSSSYEQAEVIETAFTEVVESSASAAAAATQKEATATPTTSTPEAAESAAQADVPAQEMDVQLPRQRLEGGQREGECPLGDLGQGLPGTEGPGGMGNIPGLEDDPFGSGMSDPFGSGDGPGGSDWGAGPFGEDSMGGLGLPGIPNFGDPFEDLLGDGPGGMGGDTPGGPGAINFGRTPLGGGMSKGDGENFFWEWNFMPNKESRYQRAKFVTESNEYDSCQLAYDPKWTPPSSVDPRAVMDPFTGVTEEWGTATSADYDQQEEQMEDFAKAQRDYQEEKRKQQETQSTVPGDEASMPRPDADGNNIGPVRPEDINIARVGGILVTDPAYTQWSPTTSAVDFSKTPGGVTDPGYEDGGIEKGGGVRAGGELVTDPPGTKGS